jgi:very-short-patch-repair endonuclease
MAGVPETWHQLLLSGQKWSGPLSAAAGRSAAALWGFEGWPQRGTIEVVSTRKLVAPRPDVVIHLAPLSSSEIRHRDGIPVTAPERTLLDLAAQASLKRVESAIDDALAARLTTPDRLLGYMAANGKRGRPGSKTLRHALDEVIEAAPSVRRFERRLIQALRDGRLPVPVKQHPVRAGDRTFVIDFAYPHANLGIEAHSYRHHSDRNDWEGDQERDSLLSARGWHLIYVTWRRLRDHREAVIQDIRDALALSEDKNGQRFAL